MALSPPWNNENIKNFIDAIHPRVCLWDTKSAEFKDRALKRNEWTAVSLKFQISPEDAVKKFKNLRTYFNNEYKRLEKKQKSDSSVSLDSNWFAFKSLLFLKGTDDADSGLDMETQTEVEICADYSMASNSQLPPPVQFMGAKKKKTREDPQYQEVYEVIDRVKYKLTKKSQAFGEHVNEKLSTYSQYVRNQVEYKISTILYEADMGYYNERNTRNSFSRQYSPTHNVPSTSSSYPQSIYSPTRSPFSYRPSPSPSPVSQTSNYITIDSNTVKTQTHSQFSPISTHIYANPQVTNASEYSDTIQFNIDANSLDPLQENVSKQNEEKSLQIKEIQNESDDEIICINIKSE